MAATRAASPSETGRALVGKAEGAYTNTHVKMPLVLLLLLFHHNA